MKYDDTELKRTINNLKDFKFASGKINESILFDKEINSFSIDSLIKKHADKYTYIDLWASWCAPCLSAMPASRKLADKYKNDIIFLYISIDDSREQWIGSKAFKDMQRQQDESYLLSGKFLYTGTSGLK